MHPIFIPWCAGASRHDGDWHESMSPPIGIDRSSNLVIAVYSQIQFVRAKPCRPQQFRTLSTR